MSRTQLPKGLEEALAPHLDGAIEEMAPVGGGCIANGSHVETETGASYFLKWGNEEVARTFPGEAAGLRALGQADHPLVIPEVVAFEEPEDGRPGFLLMEWVDSGRKGRSFWTDFGEGLAALHRSAADRYGFERDNFIGRLPQENTWEGRWPEFFWKHRLVPQKEMAEERGRWRSGWITSFEALGQRLPDLLPERPEASILHGDLWSGNFMVTVIGEPALIDPAAYYGHREADLAMTELFGGFDSAFYEAYRSAWPLEPGYEERRDVYNLYHLINHVNHFGGGYARQVENILRRFA